MRRRSILSAPTRVLLAGRSVRQDRCEDTRFPEPIPGQNSLVVTVFYREVHCFRAGDRGALSDQLIQALLKDDTSFFEKYYADDAVIIRARGDQYTKAQEIEIFESGANKYESYNVYGRKIRTDEDPAIENVKASAKGLINQQPFSSDYFVTRVWVKQKGNWKLVMYQVTPIAGASVSS
jgi:ketosteroid isomerase-like protein